MSYKNDYIEVIRLDDSVSRGVNKGCSAIRIPNMKECPTVEIVKTILDFIFEK